MKKTTLSLALSAAAGLGLWAPAAQAFDGTITFNGTVTAQTCEISGSSKDLAVELPTVSASTLKSDAVAGQTNFQISLSNCTPNSGQVRAYFEPGPNVDGTTYQLINTSTASGAAMGVQIRILNTELQQIKVGADQGEQDSPLFDIASDGTANMTYLAGYIKESSAASIQPGAVTANVNYTVQYE